MQLVLWQWLKIKGNRNRRVEFEGKDDRTFKDTLNSKYWRTFPKMFTKSGKTW